MSKHETRRGHGGRPSKRSSHDPHESAQAAGHRHERLTRILHEELGALVRDELGDPRLGEVRFTSVELSVDYKNARVGFVAPAAAGASREARDRLERLLARAAPFLRARLADAVDLKQVPALHFVWDTYAAASPRD
jgi:ribosome-binding factor A